MTGKRKPAVSLSAMLGWFEKGLSFLGLSLVFILMIVVSLNIITRYLFRMPLAGAVESSGLILVAIIFLPLAYAQSHGGHIRMDALINLLPSRLRNAMEAFVHTVALGVCALLLWQTMIVTLFAIKINDITTGYVDLPTSPSMIAIVIGLFALCLTFIYQIVRYSRSALSGKESQPSGDE